MSWFSKALKSPLVTTILKGAVAGAEQAALNEAERAIDNSLIRLVADNDARAAVRKLGVRLAEIHAALVAGRKEVAQGIASKTCLDVERSLE